MGMRMKKNQSYTFALELQHLRVDKAKSLQPLLTGDVSSAKTNFG